MPTEMSTVVRRRDDIYCYVMWMCMYIYGIGGCVQCVYTLIAVLWSQ